YVLNVAASPITLTPLTVTPRAMVSHDTDVPIVSGNGGSGDYRKYEIVRADGTAPDGMHFHKTYSSTGFTISLTGTPARPGEYPSFVEIKDDYGNVAIQPFTLLVWSDNQSATRLTLFSSLNNDHDLPLATVNRSYAQTFGGFGGTGTLSFQHPASVDGLTFSAAHADSSVTAVETHRDAPHNGSLRLQLNGDR